MPGPSRNKSNLPIKDAMKYAPFLLIVLLTGCGWKPKPYVRDPMGRLPLQAPSAAAVEPLAPAWPSPPLPPVDE
jgi:hypothetical protein